MAIVFTDCDCQDTPSESVQKMLTINGHSRKHYTDAAGDHCCVVFTPAGGDPQLLLDISLLSKSQLVLDMEASRDALAVAKQASAAELTRIRDKRLAGQMLTKSEESFVIDKFLKVIP